MDIDDVFGGSSRLVHRHPHVSGTWRSCVTTSPSNWERLKAEEGSKPAPPSTTTSRSRSWRWRAAKVQRRAAGWGVQWPSAGSAIACPRGVRQLADAPDDERAIAPSCSPPSRRPGASVWMPSRPRRTTRGFAERYEVYSPTPANAASTRGDQRGRAPRALPRRDAEGASLPREDDELPHRPYARIVHTPEPSGASSGRRRGGRGRTRGSLGTFAETEPPVGIATEIRPKDQAVVDGRGVRVDRGLLRACSRGAPDAGVAQSTRFKATTSWARAAPPHRRRR